MIAVTYTYILVDKLLDQGRLTPFYQNIMIDDMPKLMTLSSVVYIHLLCHY